MNRGTVAGLAAVLTVLLGWQLWQSRGEPTDISSEAQVKAPGQAGATPRPASRPVPVSTDRSAVSTKVLDTPADIEYRVIGESLDVEQAFPAAEMRAPVAIGEVLDADDPYQSGWKPTTGQPVNLGVPLDADAPQPWTAPPGESVHIGEYLNADAPYQSAWNPAAGQPVTLGAPLGADSPQPWSAPPRNPVHIGKHFDTDSGSAP